MNETLRDKYRQRLLEMRTRLIHLVNRIEEDIREEVRAPGDLSNAPTHIATEDEEGVETQVTLAENEAKILEEVEAALGRVEEDTYGRCEDCGKEIPEERLDALPYTRYCFKDASRHDDSVAHGV